MRATRARGSRTGCYVFRFDPKTGNLTVVADDFEKPNGLAFSPDEEILYVADSAVAHRPDAPRHIRAFEVWKDDSLKGGEARFILKDGIPDGFRVDTDGNIWSSGGPERSRHLRLCAGGRRPRQDQLPPERLQPLLRRAKTEPAIRDLHARTLFRLCDRHWGAAALRITLSAMCPLERRQRILAALGTASSSAGGAASVRWWSSPRGHNPSQSTPACSPRGSCDPCYQPATSMGSTKLTSPSLQGNDPT
jgi:SMP-30/Gluconolactonase/LRE-like region